MVLKGWINYGVESLQIWLESLDKAPPVVEIAEAADVPAGGCAEHKPSRVGLVVDGDYQCVVVLFIRGVGQTLEGNAYPVIGYDECF